MADIGELYDQDFLWWTQQQAAALRGAKLSNLSLDWNKSRAWGSRCAGN